MSSLRAAATLAMFLPRRASIRSLSAATLAVVGVTLHRLDRGPPDQLGALFGDMPAMHDSEVFSLGVCESGVTGVSGVS